MTVLLCDVGGVLIENPWIETARAMGTQHGKEEAVVFEALTRLSRELDGGRLSLAEFHGRVCAELGLHVEFSAFKRALESSLKKVPSVWGAVDSLRRERGARVVALSNMSREVWKSLQERFDIGSLFSSEVLSFELGILKPDPAIYIEAVKRADAQPGACLFVDDIVENIEAARALGIKAYLARRPEDTASFLRSALD
ncbi:MAG: HAD family phosphatase [Nitrososphaerota archaeon]|nr:HAD family phosphatase [Nitrososphaerota archaeon]